MSSSDTASEATRLISTGEAYAPRRDPRLAVALIFGTALAAGALAVAVYATLQDRWNDSTVALVAGCALGAAFARLMPWTRIPREGQLSIYWLSLIAIGAGVYVLDVSSLILLMLLPMMVLTYHFGRDRQVLAANLAVAVVAFLIPVITGDVADAIGAVIVTLPAIVAVALLSGVLAERLHSTRDIERGRYKSTIEALSTALTARDGYTGTHSEETLSLVSAVCEELALTVNQREFVADVALLHDIGKIGVPNDVLHFPGKLDDAQWAIMKEHPVIGERIVSRVPGLEEVARAIRHEHERWDGRGYPDGLRQAEIPLASRIVLVCDAFHAMTSDRPYREAMGVDHARMELARNAGTQFDPTIVGALLNVLDARDGVMPDVFRAQRLGAQVGM